MPAVNAYIVMQSIHNPILGLLLATLIILLVPIELYLLHKFDRFDIK